MAVGPSIKASHGAGVRTAVTAAMAAVGSVVAVEIVAAIGRAAGAPHVMQLTAGALAALTIVGVLVGTAAWVLIGRRNPGLLRRLVPAVLVLSFIPDVALGIGGTAWGAVVTLMLAHAAVFAVTVPILIARLNPTQLDG